MILVSFSLNSMIGIGRSLSCVYSCGFVLESGRMVFHESSLPAKEPIILRALARPGGLLPKLPSRLLKAKGWSGGTSSEAAT